MGFFQIVSEVVGGFATSSGMTAFFEDGGYKFLIMIIVALVFIYLAVAKEFEPLLLLPIAFGILLANLPFSGVMNPPSPDGEAGGLLYYISMGNKLGIFPPLIFLGVGALTDFGPLIANPKSLLLGAAAQFGIYVAFVGATFFGFSFQEAAATGIIGGADGPTAIFLANRLAPHLQGSIAVAAYSYMALIPIIQPPVMKFFTTKEERAIVMEQLRPVSKKEKVIFPILVTIIVVLIIPDCASLVGMLMLGNLLKESGVTGQLSKVASDTLMYGLTIFIGVSVGATTRADNFLTMQTISILILGLAAFVFATAAGVILGKVMCKMSGGKINPLIGAAGVSAVPMAARMVQKVGREENPANYLLMHAMGPNVAGVIGSAVAAGVFLAIYG